MGLVRGMICRHLFLLLLTRCSEFKEVLCSLQLLMICFQLSRHRQIPSFGVRKVAAEDYCHRLAAPHMVPEHHRNLSDDAADQGCDMHFFVLIRVNDSRNTKCAGSLPHVYMDGLNLCLLQIVRSKIYL